MDLAPDATFDIGVRHSLIGLPSTAPPTTIMCKNLFGIILLPLSFYAMMNKVFVLMSGTTLQELQRGKHFGGADYYGKNQGL